MGCTSSSSTNSKRNDTAERLPQQHQPQHPAGTSDVGVEEVLSQHHQQHPPGNAAAISHVNSNGTSSTSSSSSTSTSSNQSLSAAAPSLAATTSSNASGPRLTISLPQGADRRGDASPATRPGAVAATAAAAPRRNSADVSNTNSGCSDETTDIAVDDDEDLHPHENYSPLAPLASGKNKDAAHQQQHDHQTIVCEAGGNRSNPYKLNAAAEFAGLDEELMMGSTDSGDLFWETDNTNFNPAPIPVPSDRNSSSGGGSGSLGGSNSNNNNNNNKTNSGSLPLSPGLPCPRSASATAVFRDANEESGASFTSTASGGSGCAVSARDDVLPQVIITTPLQQMTSRRRFDNTININETNPPTRQQTSNVV